MLNLNDVEELQKRFNKSGEELSLDEVQGLYETREGVRNMPDSPLFILTTEILSAYERVMALRNSVGEQEQEVILSLQDFILLANAVKYPITHTLDK
jgi:hypothetical protein